MSWQWRMIHKLNRNWLVVFKLTWGTSQIWTWALKTICFNWLLVTKVYNVWATKYREVIFHDTQELNKFWRKFVLWFEKWREIWQSFTRALVSDKIGTLMGSFAQSRKGMTLKFTEELCVMAMMNNAEFKEELTCNFKTDMRNLTNFDLSTRKPKKIAL